MQLSFGKSKVILSILGVLLFLLPDVVILGLGILYTAVAPFIGSVD